MHEAPALLLDTCCRKGCNENSPAAVPSPYLAHVLQAIGPAFEAETPGYHLQVIPDTGTGGGVEGLLKGTLDVAAMARKAKDEGAAQGIQYVWRRNSPVTGNLLPSSAFWGMIKLQG